MEDEIKHSWERRDERLYLDGGHAYDRSSD
jgi:hypothetical protein